MRLFAALPIAEPARGEIARLLARLREPGWPLRLVHDQGLHLTMKFFGEVAPGRLEVIEEAVRAAVPGTGALHIQLAEVGAFPDCRHEPTRRNGQYCEIGRLGQLGNAGKARQPRDRRSRATDRCYAARILELEEPPHRFAAQTSGLIGSAAAR